MYAFLIALMVGVLLWDGLPEYARVILVLVLTALAVWSALDGLEPQPQGVPPMEPGRMYFPEPCCG